MTRYRERHGLYVAFSFSLLLHGAIIVFPGGDAPSPPVPADQVTHVFLRDAPPSPLPATADVDTDTETTDTVHLGIAASQKYTDYLHEIKRKIEEHWEPYTRDSPGNIAGIAVITFTIDADGCLTSSEVASSSGMPSMDEVALNIVRAAAPFTPIPPSYGLKCLHIIASFHYEGGP